MTIGGSKGRTFLVALFVAMALIVLLTPTLASAALSTWSTDPWRGSGWCNRYIYAKAGLDDSCNYHWMEVHEHLWRNFDGIWSKVASAQNGGENIDYLDCTARYTCSLTATVEGNAQREWDIDGNHYSCDWETNGPVTI